ncbi:E3 ubiquitin-protein ligase RZFP34-like isoform X1 [Rhododendron vialii]|uniref:E3 ubiquitin-protein ligase RZFP34-like isoform X1 n=1 Tax=Rhododendron vialii TaxID=182163 RepID=UPI00265F6E85|nr:E3 ubiquitin-protein ligase RZFP34-like isoform X1 [Rhododendron vialii]XP_058207915.1 E3 ubiquitin-protein ligase RZFP34-like isoform X1 [Rhododendron vialii]
MDCGLDPQMSNTSGAESLMEMGSGLFGCSHYRRRCKIRAPCCDEIFDCRHCHNESKNSLEVDPLNRHDVPRHEVKRVICSLCHAEQDVSRLVKNLWGYIYHQSLFNKNAFSAGFPWGSIFAQNANFLMMITGGEENFFHCNKCGCCYSRLMKDSHICVERAMHHNCPVCFEYLFDTTKDMSVLPCGHTIHLQCVKEMERHFQYSCPVCSKSYCDMSRAWLKLDQEVASMPMPEMYENKMVWILCNDCGETSEVNFHIVAHKCVKCNSYNTRRTRGGPASCSSRI